MTETDLRLEAVFDPETDGGPGVRLDVFWCAKLAGQDVTRARIQAAIDEGLASLNGAVCRKAGTKLRGGEKLAIGIPRKPGQAAAESGSLGLLYRDEQLIVLDKPAGLTVHPAPGLPEGTLVNRLLHHFPALRDLGGERPGIVHRLDKDTSGLLLVALTEPARLALAADFAARKVRKTYLALVHGRPEGTGGDIRLPIGRDPRHRHKMAVAHKGGREARSRWKLAWTAPDGAASLLEVEIFTGRTHQIRVHLAALGHPIVGDTVYGATPHALWTRRGGPEARLAGRQMLHAWKLAFAHPANGRTLSFRCPPPPDFWRLLLLLGRRTQRVGLVGLPGCGKSTVLGALAEAGYPTFSADAAVAALYAPGGGGAHMLAGRFGEKALAADGSVDKNWLLAAILESEAMRREVMALVHPLVRGDMEAFFAANAQARAAFAEVPLLLESGWPVAEAVDLVVGVRCALQARRQRLTASRGWDDALIDRMDGWQWPEEKKLARCRMVVDNDAGPEALAAKARQVLDTLLDMRRRDVRKRHDWLLAQGYAGKPDVPAGESR
ncbi:MAG: dephospho-CoA kinase [Solidesulfovibrio sp. DCME]|uniref:dephospho-CoA kinase n=1 Tax=Solidesulfovibrio sp. DCME TaxID=3447380 RepID=UPI003D0A2F9E